MTVAVKFLPSHRSQLCYHALQTHRTSSRDDTAQENRLRKETQRCSILTLYVRDKERAVRVTWTVGRLIRVRFGDFPPSLLMPELTLPVQ
jgi:hypothetical protein